MSSKRKNQSRHGRYEQISAEQAIRNRDEAWKEIRRAEEDYAFQKRKRRVMMICGLVLTTGAMIAFIEYGQISCVLGMCFNGALAAVFGYHTK